MSENCHEILHVDTLHKIIATVRAASQQEVAAPVWDAMVESGASALVDSCIAKGHWAHASDESKDIYRGHAKAVLLAARVPVASPAEPVAYIRKDQLQKAARSAMLCEVSPEPRQDRVGIYATPPVGAGGAGVMDARPDSFHSDSGECDRVQGPGPTDAERLDFLETIGVSYGFEDMHEGNRWMIDGPFMFVRDAIDAAILAKGGDQGEGK